jgi:hypothetical protein
MTLSNEEAAPLFYESISTVPGLQGMEFYCYDHGIMIADTTKDESEEILSLYSAIVFFNLALVSHRGEGRLRRDKSLKKAALLYGLSAQLLEGPTIPDDMSASILTLFALNNKAQIHYEQCEYIQSVDCMEEISEIMSGVDGLDSNLNTNDIKGLMLNVMLLNVPTAAQAA